MRREATNRVIQISIYSVVSSSPLAPTRPGCCLQQSHPRHGVFLLIVFLSFDFARISHVWVGGGGGGRGVLVGFVDC